MRDALGSSSRQAPQPADRPGDAGQSGPLYLELVEHGQQVVGEGLGRVAGLGAIGATRATTVVGHDPEPVVGEVRHLHLPQPAVRVTARGREHYGASGVLRPEALVAEADTVLCVDGVAARDGFKRAHGRARSLAAASLPALGRPRTVVVRGTRAVAG